MRNENDETPLHESDEQQPALLDTAKAAVVQQGEDFELGAPYCGTDGPCEGCQ